MRIRIRKAYKIFGLTLAVGACSAVTVLARDGGISGGGGGVTPANPAGTALIEQALREAPLALSLYFNERELKESERPTEIGKILFGGQTTIHDLLKTTAIETNGPCRDPHGRRREGAAPGKRANSICMDVKALGRKLSKTEYWAQTLALAGHELSHLLGTNEREASELQNQILENLRYRQSFAPVALRNSYLFSTSDLNRFVDSAEAASHENNSAQTYEAWAKAAEATKYLQAETWAWTGGIRPEPARAYWIGRAIHWKIQMLTAVSFLKLGGSSPSYTALLDRGFGNDRAAKLSDIVNRLDLNTGYRNVPADLANILLERPDTAAAADREMASIKDLLAQLETLVRKTPAAWTALVEKDYGKPGKNQISWQTEQVNLSVQDFAIETNGMSFKGDEASLELHSDPGSAEYWSLEAEWKENGVSMRTFFYFRADAKEWWVDEIRTFDGKAPDHWVYFYGDYFRRPLGEEFRGDQVLAGWNEKGSVSILKLKGMRLQVNPSR